MSPVVNNGWCDPLPAEWCDFASGAKSANRHPTEVIVSTACWDGHSWLTSERRPMCRRHAEAVLVNGVSWMNHQVDAWDVVTKARIAYSVLGHELNWGEGEFIDVPTL